MGGSFRPQTRIAIRQQGDESLIIAAARRSGTGLCSRVCELRDWRIIAASEFMLISSELDLGVVFFELAGRRRDKLRSLPILLLVVYLCAAGCRIPMNFVQQTPRCGAELNPVNRFRIEDAFSVAAAAPPGTPAAAGVVAPLPRSACRGQTFFSIRGREWPSVPKREQPDWLSPIATTSGRLKDELRFDIWRPISPPARPDYNLAGGKGLEFIVAPRLQLLLGIPSYIENPQQRPSRWFWRHAGDAEVSRGLSAAQRRRLPYHPAPARPRRPPAQMPRACMPLSLPPGVALGKGWKQFRRPTTLGGNLPTGRYGPLGKAIPVGYCLSIPGTPQALAGAGSEFQPAFWWARMRGRRRRFLPPDWDSAGFISAGHLAFPSASPFKSPSPSSTLTITSSCSPSDSRSEAQARPSRALSSPATQATIR